MRKYNVVTLLGQKWVRFPVHTQGETHRNASLPTKGGRCQGTAMTHLLPILSINASKQRKSNGKYSHSRDRYAPGKFKTWKGHVYSLRHRKSQRSDWLPIRNISVVSQTSVTIIIPPTRWMATCTWWVGLVPSRWGIQAPPDTTGIRPGGIGYRQELMSSTTAVEYRRQWPR